MWDVSAHCGWWVHVLDCVKADGDADGDDEGGGDDDSSLEALLQSGTSPGLSPQFLLGLSIPGKLANAES